MSLMRPCTKNIYSVSGHLAECRSMALVQVPLPKIRNLANFAAFIQVTQCHLYKCYCSLAQVQAIALIQVTSLTD